jgi:exodeoxyribonuclease V beta subunit
LEPIELGEHAVVEASAGTGKTYTIEQLVVNLLVADETLAIENLLVVTFTEKATGELKTRLRAALEKAVEKYPDYQAQLQRALDHFDQAPIFTIHGFCQRLLQEYALEQGQDFTAELVDDNDLLRATLRDIQRKDWRSRFGPKLKAVLEAGNFNRDTADDWERRVLEIAGKYKPRCGHQLRPAPVHDWWKRLDEPDANWAGQLELFTIQLLRQHLSEHKRQRGQQSFDDMIAQVEENLDPERNPDAEQFLATLRGRYHYGIVDEFQDTDPLQWRIFRRIFLEAGTSKLFVVGDPKQEIFGFRGADLPTYLRAADEMKREFSAREYPMEVNWRSEPDLLDALNTLFLDGDWFPERTGIRYLKVHAPDDDERQTRIEEDRTNRAALSIIDLRATQKLKAALKQYARFIAGEIRRLMHPDQSGSKLVFTKKKEKPRDLQYSDICILVLKRPEAEPIMEALRDAHIPFSFYKQTGLWQSIEAMHVETVLRCLSRPEDRSALRKALLTCFFRVKPQELVKSPELPSQHPARRLYQSWLSYADNRQWSALFQSMLEETGLLAQSADDLELDRRLAALRHLFSLLEQAGHGENLDLLGLLDWIAGKRTQRDAGDADVQAAESLRPRVKIMTIHASKGLEFPIVFMAGGFTKGPRRGVATYRDEQQRVVFDLSPDAAAETRMAEEAMSEQRRLLYVALTRPIFKLYVPYVTVTSRNLQWAGPVGTILLPALDQACPDKEGPLIAEIVPPPLLIGRFGKEENEGDGADGKPKDPLTIDGPLFRVFETSLAKRRIAIRSFSSMNRAHLAAVGDGSSFGDVVKLAADEIAAVSERDDPLRGAVFGDIVHNVLERIDFAEVGQAVDSGELLREGTPARALIDAEISANIAGLRTRVPREALEQSCRELVALLIHQSLHTPLAEAGGPLWRIPATDRLHELEFHFPEKPGDPVPADVRWEDGFVMGYMDLVFRHQGRCFLVDWKTNLLPGYAPDQVARCMAEADYHRQYQLYLQALSRWLAKSAGRGFDFKKQFGGVYYLFVRGLNGRDESSGVFFHRPTAEDLDLAAVMAR